MQIAVKSCAKAEWNNIGVRGKTERNLVYMDNWRAMPNLAGAKCWGVVWRARGMEEKFFSKFPLRPRKHLCRAICQARLSVRSLPPNFLSLSPSLSLYLSFSPSSALRPLFLRCSPLSGAFYSHSNGSTLICMLRVLAVLPVATPCHSPGRISI